MKKNLLAIRNGRLGLGKDLNFKFHIDGFYFSFKGIVWVCVESEPNQIVNMKTITLKCECPISSNRFLYRDCIET